MNAKQFNQKYSIGTEVILTDDFGDTHETVTTSEAWVYCGNDVVGVESKPGGFDLNRIQPVYP